MYLKILKSAVGIALIGVGVIGIFLPIIPGILLILAGLFLMGIRIKDIKRWVSKLEF